MQIGKATALTICRRTRHTGNDTDCLGANRLKIVKYLLFSVDITGLNRF